jgi:hypothetical protein
MTQELKVLSDFYDFMLLNIRHSEKFPRHNGYSLGLAMEDGIGFGDLMIFCELWLTGR